MADRDVPRRTFLATAAASVAGVSLGLAGVSRTAQGERHAGVHTAAPTAVRLGIASFSLRNFPLEKALLMMKELHAPFVNFKSVHLPYDASPQELASRRAQIQAAGLQIVGTGTITFEKDTDDDVRRYFDYARAAGSPLITGTGAPEVMPRVERFARQYDVKVAIHNHGPEDRFFPSPYDVLRVVKNMDSRMGLCIDVGHTARTGTDVAQAVRDAGPRLLDMHMKDLRDPRAIDSQVIVGEGALPIPDVFRALDAIRYGGYVNLEYEIDADDPLPGMKQSLAYMRGVLAGMAPRRSVLAAPALSSGVGANGALNQLTRAERAAGWTLLFDGHSFAGWRGLGYASVPVAHWTIEDGAIKKIASGTIPVQADGQPKEGGDLMTERTYRDFELQWDWKISPAGNSGVKYNVSEELSTSIDPPHAAKGFEYQMLDDDRHSDGKLPTHRAGALYDLFAPPDDKPIKPVGEWNHSVIVFIGNHGEHWLNGRKIVEFELGSPAMTSALAKSKYAPIPWFAERRAGHIVLQDHGDEAYFRNLKIRELHR